MNFTNTVYTAAENFVPIDPYHPALPISLFLRTQSLKKFKSLRSQIKTEQPHKSYCASIINRTEENPKNFWNKSLRSHIKREAKQRYKSHCESIVNGI